MPMARSRKHQGLQNAPMAALITLLLFASPLWAKTSGHHVASRITAPAAEDLFVKILQCDDLFTYRGRQITTYWMTGRVIAAQVYHQPPDLSRIYYLDPENLHGRLLVSDGRQQWEYDPRLRELHHRLLSPGALDDDDLLSYTLLRVNYLLSVYPSPKTWEDRKVWLITIKRPGAWTIARKFWVDDGSGLILKREIYREDGRLAVTVAFSDIDFHPKSSAAAYNMADLENTKGVRFMETPSVPETPLALKFVSSQLMGKAYAPAELSGYHLVGASTTAVEGKTLLHLRYSDGLNLVSLFEQRRSLTQRPTRVPAGMRAIQIGKVHGHVSRHSSLTTLNWDTASLNITLMGELGIDTLCTLAAEANK